MRPTLRLSASPAVPDRLRMLLPLLFLAGEVWGADDVGRHVASSAEAGLMEEVVTTATKKSVAESAQDVPAAMTVLGAEALAKRHLTDLGNLAMALPNVALDEVGIAKGIANFSIRGQGVSGSIPSIDPTVGVFVDGMYLGLNYGVVLDLLDLEAVEVLRGPQGLLFGRNVTGGAVLLRSRRPSGARSAEAAMRVESGVEWRLTGSLERPLIDDRLKVRLSGSYRDDAGWFRNQADGRSLGADVSWVARPVVTWTPTDDLEVTLIHERGDTEADGPATRNRRLLKGFDVEVDERGFADIEWQHWILEANRDLASGRGRITNLFGWRALDQERVHDVDSTRLPIFHSFGATAQRQVSNELRYAHRFSGGAEVTVGAYFFSQALRYRERRFLRGAWGGLFGGNQDHVTGGAFVNAELPLGGRWGLTAGARYTYERKDVLVATSGVSACAPDTLRCPFDFEDADAWRNVTPKLGLQRWLDEQTQLYAHYTKGFRSGGYNLRNTAPGVAPGPFDEEEQDSFEIGLKTDFANGRARLNLAAFHNRIRGMQRQVTRADAATGGVQITANTADATIQGLEGEFVAALGRAATLSGFVGVIDGRYQRVRFDLNGDGSTVGDRKLDLPRLARLTWGVEANYARPIGRQGRLALRAALTHRDGGVATDDNRGVLKGGEMLEASIGFAPNEALEFNLYGRNLLHQALWHIDVDLSALLDSTFSALREGRVVGIEVRASL